MVVALGILLIAFGLTLLWAIWQAHKGFWQTPRSESPYRPRPPGGRRHRESGLHEECHRDPGRNEEG